MSRVGKIRKRIEREQRAKRLELERADRAIFGEAWTDCRVKDCITYRPPKENYYCAATNNSIVYRRAKKELLGA